MCPPQQNILSEDSFQKTSHDTTGPPKKSEISTPCMRVYMCTHLCMCVYMCVHTWMCIWVGTLGLCVCVCSCVSVCVCVYGCIHASQGQHQASFHRNPPLWFFETRSFIKPWYLPIRPGCLGNQSQGSTCLLFQCWDPNTCHHTQLCTWNLKTQLCPSHLYGKHFTERTSPERFTPLQMPGEHWGGRFMHGR